MSDVLFDDAVAARYDRFCETPMGGWVDRVERDLLWSLLALSPGLSVVDLGCATGALTLALAQSGCRAVGVDISPAMLARARAKAPDGEQVRWVESDLAKLPFPDGTFARALVHVTLEFVASPQRVLDEAVRVLAPEGILVVGLVLAGGRWAAHYRRRGSTDPRSVWRQARFFDCETLAEWMGRPADVERRGLWVGPEDWPGVEEARVIERGGGHDAGQAGFAALAWRLDPGCRVSRTSRGGRADFGGRRRS